MTTLTPTRDIDLTNIPHPAGATSVYEWDPTSTDGNPGRYYTGFRWDVDLDGHNTVIDIDGTQYADGEVSRNVNVIEDRCERLMDLTSERARRIGLALIAAADQVDAAAG